MKTEKYSFYLYEEVAGIGDQRHQFPGPFRDFANSLNTFRESRIPRLHKFTVTYIYQFEHKQRYCVS